MINLTLNKKKKKKKTFDMTEETEEAPSISATIPAINEIATEQLPSTVKPTEVDDEFGAIPKDRKKKKKKKTLEFSVDAPTEQEAASHDQNNAEEEHDAEAEFTYDELLERVFNLIRQKNPDLIAGEKIRLTIRPPQVTRVGTRRSAFVNFMDICKSLHRQSEHLILFLMAELGTSGSLDASNALIIKGKFDQKQIEQVLRRYIREYVTCHTCRSPNTILRKENRLFFLQCESCQANCSVASIQSGFQAVTSKRSKLKPQQ